MFIAFILIELFVAPEPILPPFLLKQKIPVVVTISNVLVSHALIVASRLNVDMDLE
jgi:hypothetical protein